MQHHARSKRHAPDGTSRWLVRKITFSESCFSSCDAHIHVCGHSEKNGCLSCSANCEIFWQTSCPRGECDYMQSHGTHRKHVERLAAADREG
jgi:hypothetical protein